MSAASADKKTLAYELGEALSEMTDHYLLMTATPHKGDPENFCLFLELLDRDVYGDVASLEEAMRRNSAPFYLRRTKEALVTFPDPETGECQQALHQARRPDGRVPDRRRRVGFLRRPDPVTSKTSRSRPRPTTRPRPGGRLHDGDAPAPLRIQRLRRPPQPGTHARQAAEDPRRPRSVPPGADRPRSSPTTSTTCPKKSSRRSSTHLEEVVASVDPAALREEIVQIGKLIDQARLLEKREVESKLVKLREVLTD